MRAQRAARPSSTRCARRRTPIPAHRRASGGSTDADAVVGATSWTPPYNLLVSSLPPEAAPGLAAAAIERARRLGVRPGRCSRTCDFGAGGRGRMDARQPTTGSSATARSCSTSSNRSPRLRCRPARAGRAVRDDVRACQRLARSPSAPRSITSPFPTRVDCRSHGARLGFDLWIDGRPARLHGRPSDRGGSRARRSGVHAARASQPRLRTAAHLRGHGGGDGRGPTCIAPCSSQMQPILSRTRSTVRPGMSRAASTWRSSSRSDPPSSAH